MDYLLAKAEEFQHKGIGTEILTVDNHADAAYIYLKIKEKDPARAEQVMELLSLTGVTVQVWALAAWTLTVMCILTSSGNTTA